MNWLRTSPYSIKIKKLDFIDSERNDRQVPIKVYLPQTETADQKLPCVIWSHGLGGSRDGAAFLARFIAEQGFIVINVTHRGTDTTLWEGKPGHPWDAIRAAHISRRTTLHRFRDIPFVLNEIERQKDDELFRQIDFDRLGMSGHSFGAITTQIMAGQMLGRGRRRYSLKEERFKAGICYSMSQTYNGEESPEEIYSTINIPMLYMTGTDDSSPISGKDYTYRLAIYEAATGPDQHVVILEDGDHMVFAGSRGGLTENPKRAEHEAIIKDLSLAFWHGYLNDNQEALNWLHSDQVRDYLAHQAEWKTRNIK